MNDIAFSPSYTAFSGDQCLATGAPSHVAGAARAALDAQPGRSLLVFDDATGRQVDLDLRGSPDEVVARLRVAEASPEAEVAPAAPVPRGPGRPRLGVVAREVTLLPRHWEWLSAQPGGASVTLRKLVDAAKRENAWHDRVRSAQAACDAFMQTMAGNRPGYEEASRALYSGDAAAFREHISGWPVDIRAHAARLALTAFEIEEPALA
ncbi:hypothetical protein ANDA3_3625 [plant metagenome]|uniref:DUF2239 domain-containing protein n=1 Tax=plant metagenome TaxID=1297885 RepID=A0A484TIZ6_9ZZZZ